MSVSHLIILLVIALLIFGPTRIESIGTSLGKAVRGFKKGLDGELDEKATPATTVANADKPADVAPKA